MRTEDFLAEPDHPILPHAHKYEVVRIDWRIREEHRFVDLFLQHHGTRELRAFRFYEPSDLSIDRFFSGFNSGFAIKDISGRGWESTVAVTTFEQDPAIRFVARSVEERPVNEEPGVTDS
jgi:hypothetical protein